MKNEDYLGKKAVCKITGFKGTITAVIYYINGCAQVCIRPTVDKDGKIVEGEYIDIQDIDIIEPASHKPTKTKPSGGNRPGGPQRDCPKN